ncbi:hypothetical protein GCM10010166_64120 [Couchioplanes caeruleus subsp. azureus]|nr:hypothetical protein GCM10010166_64120 [Couchioplanes caeruleus subsp. azureus]
MHLDAPGRLTARRAPVVPDSLSSTDHAVLDEVFGPGAEARLAPYSHGRVPAALCGRAADRARAAGLWRHHRPVRRHLLIAGLVALLVVPCVGAVWMAVRGENALILNVLSTIAIVLAAVTLYSRIIGLGYDRRFTPQGQRAMAEVAARHEALRRRDVALSLADAFAVEGADLRQWPGLTAAQPPPWLTGVAWQPPHAPERQRANIDALYEVIDAMDGALRPPPNSGTREIGGGGGGGS